jgi:DHA3 family macrolide efflux protein-like MFS transporter
MARFLVIWAGQVITLAGSALTTFALGVTVYRETGSIARFAFLALLTAVPALLVMPLAGAVADRLDRRWVMLAGELGAAAATLWLAIVTAGGQPPLWAIYVSVPLISACTSLEVPAYLAMATQLVARDQYGRVAGLLQLGPSAAELLSPTLAAYLLTVIQLRGLLLIDLVTYLAAAGALLATPIPRLPPDPPVIGSRQANLRRPDDGWRYIAAHRQLITLSILFAATSFLGGMISVLLVPMVLQLTSVRTLGTLLTIAGSGLLSGGALMSLWGGPRRSILGVLGFQLLAGVCLILMGVRPIIGLIALGAFGVHFAGPLANGCNHTIWQRAVPPELQGRVFAARQMAVITPRPLAYLLAAPLVNGVLQRLVTDHRPLGGTIDLLVGHGQARAIGLAFVLLGGMLLCLVLLVSAKLRITPQIPSSPSTPAAVPAPSHLPPTTPVPAEDAASTSPPPP